MVEFSFPFQSAFYRILIKRPGNNINWVTYTKGYTILHIAYFLMKFSTFTSAVFYSDVWLTLFLGMILSCICCGVLFFNHASDTDSWIRSFNLV